MTSRDEPLALGITTGRAAASSFRDVSGRFASGDDHSNGVAGRDAVARRSARLKSPPADRQTADVPQHVRLARSKLSRWHLASSLSTRETEPLALGTVPHGRSSARSDPCCVNDPSLPSRAQPLALGVATRRRGRHLSCPFEPSRAQPLALGVATAAHRLPRVKRAPVSRAQPLALGVATVPPFRASDRSGTAREHSPSR